MRNDCIVATDYDAIGYLEITVLKLKKIDPMFII
jgi:hypothetical protein